MITLYEHQQQALNITKTHNRVGYFLDMGLGKTFVGSEKMYELDALHNFVVCQKSKVQDWIDHFNENYDGDYLVLNLTQKKDSSTFQAIVEGNAGVLSETYVVGVINYDLLFRRSYIPHISSFTLLYNDVRNNPDCDFCPVTWDNCRYCHDNESLYMELVSCYNSKRFIELARKIANLPERVV